MRAYAAPRPLRDPTTDRSGAAKVCAIIVSYNSAGVLPGLLDTIEAGMSGIERFEVIVADNASADRSVEIARSHPSQPRILETGGNIGYAAAINAAAALAEPDAHLLILNPDIRLFPGCVAPLIAHADDRRIGIAVPCNLRDDGSVDPTIRREPSLVTVWSEALLGGKIAARLGLGEIVAFGYTDEKPIAWASGSALLVTPLARKAVAAWDESYFLYSEEVDYQQRVRAAGLDILFVPRSRITHFCGDYRRNPRLYALMTANRMRYFNRRHGALGALLFRLGIIVGEAVRAPLDPIHRAALACALMPLAPALSFRSDG